MGNGQTLVVLGSASVAPIASPNAVGNFNDTISYDAVGNFTDAISNVAVGNLTDTISNVAVTYTPMPPTTNADAVQTLPTWGVPN